MRKRVPLLLFSALLLFLPQAAFPVTLVRVGYINLDTIIDRYARKYLAAEIEMRETHIAQLQAKYNNDYARMAERERMDTLKKIRDQRDALGMLKSNRNRWETSGDFQDDVVFQIVQRDIIESIKKTSELEGFSLVLDSTGNFVYGSDDINLTDKVLFRLDEKLLDLQSRPPLAPLSLELEAGGTPDTTERTTD